MTRRLAAILAADVVGYSSLMNEDETGTLAALRAHRAEVFNPIIANRGGRIVKLMGDGALVEFSSVVEAVEAALSIQQETARSGGPITLRIGINLGDVILDGDDIYGDGVNVAARLESLAKPGGICISANVRESIGTRLGAEFANAGEYEVKGLPRPVGIWRWGDQTKSSAHEQPDVMGSPRANKPVIAVLPFANMSGDPEQTYLSDGITEDVVTELSRFHRLSVMSASSSARYRDAGGVHGTDVGVQYVVEGSVRRLGERVRITSRLLDATTGGQVWAERFDREFEEIFEVQDEIVKRIVGTVAGRVESAGSERARRKPPASLDAYECVLRGKACQIGDPEAEAEARHLFERAIELDPRYALAHSHLAHILSLAWLREQSDSDELLDRALEHSRRAVALDSSEPDCVNSLGWIHLHCGSSDLAERYYRRALDLNPNDAEQVAFMGVLNAFLGNSEDSIAAFAQAQTLDPFFEPPWYWTIQGVAYFTADRIDEAIGCFERSPNMPTWVCVYSAACNALVGDTGAAAVQAEVVLREWPEFSLQRFARKEPLRREEDRMRLVEAMRLARLPE